jgi:hypothetical protein
MATNVTQSLFGMTPEALQSQRAAALDQQALQFAQLSPMQQAQMGLFRAGSQLGTGLAGLMGYQDPEMRRIQARQGLLGGIDMSDPDALRQAAQQAQQSGDFAAAQELINRANEAALSQARVGKETALTTKALTEADIKTTELAAKNMGTQGRAAYIKRRMPELSDEEIAGLASDEAIVRELLKEPGVKTQVVETAEGQLLINKETGSLIANLGPSPERGTRVNVNVANTAENEYARSVGKSTAEKDINDITAVQQVAQTLPKMYEARQLLETGDLNTGFAAETLLVFDRARAKFLADKKAGKRVTDTEYLDALLGSDVFPQISALGIGARGLDTPAEREFLRQVITGTISMDRETLKRMTDFRIKSAENAVKKYNERLGQGDFEQYQRITGRPLSPVSMDRPPEAPRATMRYNPQTGRLEPVGR